MKDSKKFQRNIEDFECLNCNRLISGNGYTNHCPICLWSRHVDLNPGDRKSDCLGMMLPKELNQRGGEYSIIHKCQSCGLLKKNKISENDDFDNLIKISSKIRK